MTKRFAIAVLVLLAIAALLFALRQALVGSESAPLPDKQVPAAETLMTGPGTNQDQQAPTDAVSPQRELIAEPSTATIARPATTGELLLHVRFADDHSPATGMIMALRRVEDRQLDHRRGRTDESGDVRFVDLPPGKVTVASHLGHSGPDVEVRAGQTTEVDVDLADGLRVTGIVVDPAGVPVAGAIVERTTAVGWLTEAVATTDHDGRFEVRRVASWSTIGARAAGHSSSITREVAGKVGSTVDVRLELGSAGGVIDGDIVGPDGAPVAGAVLRVGKLDERPPADTAGPPLPAIVRTGDDGRFHAVGVPPGTQPVAVRTATFAPWAGDCDVVACQTRMLHVVLQAGATLRGIVLDGAGASVAGADVRLGNSWPVGHGARTRPDGTFEINGLPEGELTVEASRHGSGRLSQAVQLRLATVTTCELRLSTGLVLRGRVRGEANAPVRAMISCRPTREVPGGWSGGALVDEQGRFHVTNCPEDDTITVLVMSPRCALIRQTGVDPRAGELEFVVHPEVRAVATVVGRVVGTDGRPIINVAVSCFRNSETGYSAMGTTTDADGRFRIADLAVGTSSVLVSPDGHPELVVPGHELTAGETWDIGAVQLTVGGTASMQIRSGDPDGVEFLIVDVPHTRNWAMQGGNGVWRSRVLAAGDYRLRISGKATAAQSLPFPVRAGEETMIEVALSSGLSQRIEVIWPDGVRPDRATIEVSRAGVVVQEAAAAAEAGRSVAQVCLAPGSYSVTATAGKLSGGATFTIGDTVGPPVRIEVR